MTPVSLRTILLSLLVLQNSPILLKWGILTILHTLLRTMDTTTKMLAFTDPLDELLKKRSTVRTERDKNRDVYWIYVNQTQKDISEIAPTEN